MEEKTNLLDVLASEPFEQCEKQWRKLLRKLKLELFYVLPIQKILKQAGWRKHPNPLGYIKTAALRTAERMGLVDPKPKEGMEVLAADLYYTDWEGRALEHDEKLDMALHEYDEKSGENKDWVETPIDRIQWQFWEEGEVDWEQVEELADLDYGEQIVLELRSMGFSRNMALDACYSSEDRRFLQSAWKRLDRDKELIKKVLTSGQPAKKKPAKRPAEDAQLAILLGPDGEMKISFEFNVPKNRKTRI